MKKVVIDFINNHWHEVHTSGHEDTFTKKEILELVKNDRETLDWVFGEVMNSRCEINYLFPFIFEHPDEDEFSIYKIKNKFYKYDHVTEHYEIVKLKYKKVTYFE